jgi:ABC-type transport system involved in multi-copper enzyme maturation permease subunit
MSQLLAFLGDSFREAMDRKALLVLFIISSFFILLCFSISFEADGPEKVLADQAGRLTRPAAEVSGINGPDWPPELQGGYRVDLKFEKGEDVDTLARSWEDTKELRRGHLRSRSRTPAESPAERGDPRSRLAFIDDRFRAFGYNHVEVKELSAEPPAYRVGVRSDYPHELSGAHHMAIGFGLLPAFPLTGTSMAEVIVQIQVSFANLFAGFVGMLVAVVVCSSFVPNMLQKGTLDFILARPLGRTRILLYKYLGGIGFIFVLAAYLIGGAWLGLSLRTSYFNPWFLLTIVTVTGVFAVLNSICVLFGVLTRSGAVSSLLAIGVWGLSSTIIGTRRALPIMFPGEVPAALTRSLDVAYAVLPKTADIGLLNQYFLSRSHLSPEAMARVIPLEMLKVDWLYSLGTTALFTAAMLGLAVWVFHRRDA